MPKRALTEEQQAAEIARSIEPSARGGRICSSCQSPWRERIRGMLMVKIEERPELSVSHIHETLKKVYGYNREKTAFRSHLVNHEPDLWAKVEEQERGK